LRELVVDVTATFDAGSRFVISGDAATIDSRDAANLSMCLHELCTNAVKYGSLSNDEGVVLIDWVTENDLVVLRWTEEGGPPVQPPSRRGFGSKLLQAGVFGPLGGVDLDYRPQGLRATMSLRLGAAGNAFR
jgi:two-component sensor histidine kinase